MKNNKTVIIIIGMITGHNQSRTNKIEIDSSHLPNMEWYSLLRF
jgi:hypothetical protein